jgi:hypothetical protein
MRNLILVLLTSFSLYVPLCSEEFQYIDVKPGQTLWEISQIYLKNPQKWDVIVSYNKLPPDPYQSLTGKRLKVPVSIIKEEYRAARFLKVGGDVKVRAVNKSVWNDGAKIKSLFKGDTVRTNADSFADVKFYTGQMLNIFANSMVILKPPVKEATDIKLLSGEIKARDTSIITISARITPKVKNTELAAKIKEDLSTVVQVYKGEAEVETSGEKVNLKEGFSSEVKLNSVPSVPKKIPDIITDDNKQNFDLNVSKNIISVKLASKAPDLNSKNVDVGDTSKAKNLKLNSNVNVDLSKAVSGYRLQVAKDREFKNIVLDRNFDVFRTLDLSVYIPAGKYYFRISYIDLIGFEGDFSDPKEITVE